MLIRIYQDNPNPKAVQQVVNCLRNGGVIIYPTDTVYAIGCDVTQPKALERVARIKGLKLEKADFSFIFYDLSHLSDYTLQVDTPTYKLLKRALPGPYTFILKANSIIPKIFKSKKKTIGIRIPDSNIIRTIVNELGNPVVSTSVHDDDDVIEYTTDPELIHERYENLVDIVVDGGYGDNFASTVLDLSEGEVEIIREGKGLVEDIL